MAQKPSVPEVLPLVQDFYAKAGNGSGGHLHIVLEDGNVSDSDVRFCVEAAREAGDQDALVLGETLLSMSKTQRLKLGRSRG